MTNSRTQSKPTAAKPGSIKALSYLIKASKNAFANSVVYFALFNDS